MELSNKIKNQHLLWRSGFGPAVEQWGDSSSYTPAQFYKAIAEASTKAPQYFNVTDDALRNMYENYKDYGKRSAATATERRQFNQKQKAAIRDLNIYWLKEMASSPAQLREKMAFFWHGHFACRTQDLRYNQLLLHTLRTHALGSFRTLLKEVSRSAAMLHFLNNQQNKKDHPNENFAREVMELFTLGRGNYTENDIKEAAKAFTGWTSNAAGEFLFKQNQHDDGMKIIFGKKGKFDGDDVLDMLLDNSQTARYITQKVYRFFVNDTVNEAIVTQLAHEFYQSDYNIGQLMKTIFTSDWFYHTKNIGVRIKSPVELLVGIQRMIPMQLADDTAWLNLQRILGQQLLYPPNVAGWPGGKNWIDSSTLMARMRIPQMFNNTDMLNIHPKDDDDQTMGMSQPNDGQMALSKKKKNAKYTINATIDWPQYISALQQVCKEDLLSTIQQQLYQVKASGIKNALQKNVDTHSREAYIISVTLQLMSTPEYQLC